VQYCSDKVRVITYNTGSEVDVAWTLTIEDAEVATYFRTLLSGVLPEFSERVFNYCYFILSLYTECEGNPYDFYGNFKIRGQKWNQISNDGNEIEINYYHCFVFQREMLYAGILWSQRYRKQLLTEVCIPEMRSIVEEYMKEGV
jgi:hypothetical protein